jgi:acetylornithine/succinyldiaminopimelate/putrescine aminotransferase
MNPFSREFVDKAEVLAASERYWNPDKTRFWQGAGIPLVIAKREGYVLHDLDGHTLVDVHLNGGTYNLGHRHPELVGALIDAVQHVDIGNHHFPSAWRTSMAKRLIETAPAGLTRVAFGTTGSETIDLAIKSARFATGRRKIVSIMKAYDGHTGLAEATGDERFSKRFLSDRPDEFVQVPLNDVDAMAAVLRGHDVAAVIMETVPVTYGFPMPRPGYLAEVKTLCEAADALYIADEVQTGLMRTGVLWAITKHGVKPDILVTSNGLGGGLYPIGAAVLSARAGAWLEQDGFAHMSTFAGAELGCAVALKVMDLTLHPDTQANIATASEAFTRGLAGIRERHAGWFKGVRQDGLIMGLEFASPDGAKHVMRALYERGVWAIFSTLDPSVLQFKPGLLISPLMVDDVLGCLEDAIRVTAPVRRPTALLA